MGVGPPYGTPQHVQGELPTATPLEPWQLLPLFPAPHDATHAQHCHRPYSTPTPCQAPSHYPPSTPHLRRRVLKVRDALKPLFVGEVQFKTGKRFAWSKPCLLVVTATAVLVLDVQSQGELEARDGSHASIQLAVRASEVRVSVEAAAAVAIWRWSWPLFWCVLLEQIVGLEATRLQQRR